MKWFYPSLACEAMNLFTVASGSHSCTSDAKGQPSHWKVTSQNEWLPPKSWVNRVLPSVSTLPPTCFSGQHLPRPHAADQNRMQTSRRGCGRRRVASQLRVYSSHTPSHEGTSTGSSTGSYSHCVWCLSHVMPRGRCSAVTMVSVYILPMIDE